MNDFAENCFTNAPWGKPTGAFFLFEQRFRWEQVKLDWETVTQLGERCGTWKPYDEQTGR